MSMAGRIAVMDDGRIAQIGTPRRGLRAPGQPLRRRLPRRGQSVRRHASPACEGGTARVDAPRPARRSTSRMRGRSAPGSAVAVAVRPEKTAARRTADRRRPTRSPARSHGVAYRGEASTCRDRARRAASWCASPSPMPRGARRRLARGRRVCLAWRARRRRWCSSDERRGARAGAGAALCLAAAVLPGAVPDRAEDQPRRAGDRHSALHAARSTDGQARTSTGANYRFLVERRLYCARLSRRDPLSPRSRPSCCLLLGYPMAYAHRARAGALAQRAAAAGDPAVLDQLPDPRLCLDRAAEGQRPHQHALLSARRRSTRRCRSSTTPSPSCSASSMPICRSWCCRSTRALEKLDPALLEAAADLGCRPCARVLARDPAAVAARHRRRRAAGLHPGGRRVRHPRPAGRARTR